MISVYKNDETIYSKNTKLLMGIKRKYISLNYLLVKKISVNFIDNLFPFVD